MTSLWEGVVRKIAGFFDAKLGSTRLPGENTGDAIKNVIHNQLILAIF